MNQRAVIKWLFDFLSGKRKTVKEKAKMSSLVKVTDDQKKKGLVSHLPEKHISDPKTLGKIFWWEINLNLFGSCAPHYNWCKTSTALKEKNNQEWPSQSLNLNSVKMMWQNLKHAWKSSNMVELEQFCTEQWWLAHKNLFAVVTGCSYIRPGCFGQFFSY